MSNLGCILPSASDTQSLLEWKINTLSFSRINADCDAITIPHCRHHCRKSPNFGTFGWIYPSSKRRLIQRTSVCRRFLQARMPLFKILEKFAPLIILSSAEWEAFYRVRHFFYLCASFILSLSFFVCLVVSVWCIFGFNFSPFWTDIECPPPSLELYFMGRQNRKIFNVTHSKLS